MYDFHCPQCSTELMVKDWREKFSTGINEPWCFCPKCKYKCFAPRKSTSEVKDKLIGEMTWKYIDRMDDPDPVSDPAEKILQEFVEEWHKIWYGEE